MARPLCAFGHNIVKHNCDFLKISTRWSNTLSNHVLEKHRKSRLSWQREKKEEAKDVTAPADYRYVYPDFLPDPLWKHRDRIAEKLERRDMLRRRTVIEIPEFYVGSIMAVTVSDQFAPGKKNRFVGICIARERVGLRASFTLRNVIDKQGVEIMYEMYNPTIQKIEVLKLEKRLDEELYYLRDAPQQYSTVPFDFEPVPHPTGAEIPVNTVKVKLNQMPWRDRWERRDDLQGFEMPEIDPKYWKKKEKTLTPWEKWDLMKEYRESINDVEAEEIMGEIYPESQRIEKEHNSRRLLELFAKEKTTKK